MFLFLNIIVLSIKLIILYLFSVRKITVCYIF